MPALNNVQFEILKLFHENQSEQELAEIKQLLSEYLFKKAIRLADEVYDEKGYTNRDVEKWKDENFRIPYR